MKTIAILTDVFPFGGGEEFLEHEIPYWTSKDVAVVLLPQKRPVNGHLRDVPACIQVDETLAHARRRLRFIVPAVCDVLLWTEFWRESLSLASLDSARASALMNTIKDSFRTAVLTRALSAVSKNRGGIDLAYAYWNDVQAYAAVRCRRRGAVATVVTRVHRFDLFEELRPARHMPLKREYVNEMAQIHAVFGDAVALFRDTYGVHGGNIRWSRLGVPVGEGIVPPSAMDGLRIVTISYCKPVKRLNLVVNALRILSRQQPDWRIEWVHIGGGPLFDRLEREASCALASLSNVTYQLTGTMANKDVMQFLAGQPWDFLLNTSASEGVPVSMMEAMSMGIPVLATDVGGVSELVYPQSGMLLPSHPTAEEVADVMRKFAPLAKDANTRAAARRKIVQDFNANLNYPMFVAELRQLISV